MCFRLYSLLSCCFLFYGLPPVSASPTTICLSTGLDGKLGDASSGYPSISSDGRFVAFSSEASNLVLNDVPKTRDVFIRDLETGSLTCASLSIHGLPNQIAIPEVCAPEISGNGRFVLFASAQSTLVSSDTNNAFDLFLYDRETQTKERVNLTSEGEPSQGGVSTFHTDLAVSSDGRFVVYASEASDLVPGDTNGQQDIFVRDRLLKQTRRVSVATDGTQGDAPCSDVSISPDDRYVAFITYGQKLDPAPATHLPKDIYLNDLATGRTTRVSTPVAITTSYTGCQSVDLSTGARYVVFTTGTDYMVPGDTNRWLDVFRYDRQTGEVRQISVASDGSKGDSNSASAKISPDGRYVWFVSFTTNLVPDNTNTGEDVFVHDCESGRTRRVSVSAAGTETGGNPFILGFSASDDGKSLAFASYSNDVVPDDKNGTHDVFVRGLLDDPLKGDVDDSGVISRRDVNLCLRLAAGLPADGALEPSRADIDGDGRVSLVDPTLLLRRLNGF